jgi:hypothetical protein
MPILIYAISLEDYFAFISLYFMNSNSEV